jgi:hypothetical protein
VIPNVLVVLTANLCILPKSHLDGRNEKTAPSEITFVVYAIRKSIALQIPIQQRRPPLPPPFYIACVRPIQLAALFT